LRVYLLDADDDLAAQFDVRTRIAVRQNTTVRVLEASAGQCDLGSALERVRGGLGLLVLDGLLAFETRLGERTAAELLGVGDLVQPPGERPDAMLDRSDSWRVLWPARFGLLDAEFAERARHWPQITQALLRRAGRRSAARGPPRPDLLAPGRALGPGRARGDPVEAAPHPPPAGTAGGG
jgi:hypothetical protein